MWRVVFRSHQRHPLRLVLVCLAISVGVAFLAGTFILTDTDHQSVSATSEQAYGHVSVAVQGHRSSSNLPGLAGFVPVPESVLATVRGVPGVAQSQGEVDGYAQLVGADGTLIGGNSSTAKGISVGPVPNLRPFVLDAGRLPSSPAEVVVDAHTFASQGWHLGQSVRVATSQPTRRFTVVGTVDLASVIRRAGVDAGRLHRADGATSARDPGVLQRDPDVVGTGPVGADAGRTRRLCGRPGLLRPHRSGLHRRDRRHQQHGRPEVHDDPRCRPWYRPLRRCAGDLQHHQHPGGATAQGAGPAALHGGVAIRSSTARCWAKRRSWASWPRGSGCVSGLAAAAILRGSITSHGAQTSAAGLVVGWHTIVV